MNSNCDIAVVGLAVMGQNLILNIADHGFKVAAYNRTIAKVDDFLSDAAKGKENVVGVRSIAEMVAACKRPRRIMLMVKAGSAVDEFIAHAAPLLEAGDCIIDGGNSHYGDTSRRVKELSAKGILYVGSGVSGGEEGARNGPSLMPGGNTAAWPLIKPIFQSICAKTADGAPCCDWIGEGGAGHYVKMVHNGIEYGDMQIIAEAYHVLKSVLGLSNAEMHDVFTAWNTTELDSYLIEITRDILAFKDEKGAYVVDAILDSAGQKGTGKWTGISALDFGVPVTLIAEAVFSRCLSSLKADRVAASRVLPGPSATFQGNRESFIEDVRRAVLAAKIISYAQGFMLMRQASEEFSWHLNYGSIALTWRGGCIIRSVFLGKIKDAFDRNPDLRTILLDSYFTALIRDCQESWRNTVATAAQLGVPAPAFSTALSFYDGYRSERLPANLLQAQRDYFGAHTYERVDGPAGKHFHTNWTGTGGHVAASTYTA